MASKNWISLLNKLGFDKISFPILIKNNSDIDLVYKLEYFANDPDFHYWKFEDNFELIDSNGNVFADLF
jgi:hypothetical protein